MEDTPVHALDYVGVLRRRKWWLIGPIVAATVVGVALVRFLPKEYTASATMAVLSSGVASNLVSPSTPIDNGERIRAVSQQLLSSRVLTRVAKEAGLSSSPDEMLLGRLRTAVKVTIPTPLTADDPKRLDTFVVSYVDDDPARAQLVANKLAAVFVDDSTKARQQRAEYTASFISAELAASQMRLSDLQAKLRRAKESHIGQLPEQTQANLQTLSGLRQQTDSNATALRGEQDRLSMIERQLESVTQGGIDTVTMTARPGAPMDPGLSADARIVALERELATARQAYTDKHPDVVRLREDLANAKAEAAREHERPVADRMAQLRTDPAYRQLSGDRDAARLRIRELERVEADLRRQIGAYQSRVEAAPMVEQELASVQRDYDLEKQQYVELSSKLSAAGIAENVERTRTGERFAVLYQAGYPVDPTKPVPWRVMLLSVVGGICLGIGCMVGREYFDRSVHDVRDLRDGLDLSVLGEVTHITSAGAPA
jgi:polysaccharide chain length determinant protein (PEP-CTERM system associated)